jgi:hypothetical protein
MLRKKVQALADKQYIHNVDSDVNKNVPRPAGSAGNNFNIQNEMGLGGNTNDREQYLAIMVYRVPNQDNNLTMDLVKRNMHNLTHQASINWEQPWAKTPAGAKEKLFAVVSQIH